MFPKLHMFKKSNRKEKLKPSTIYLGKYERKVLYSISKRTGISRSKLVRYAIDVYLRREFKDIKLDRSFENDEIERNN